MAYTLKQTGLSLPDVTAEICRKSFYQFVKRFWSVLIDAPPIWNWHIETICNEMQIVAERVFRGEKKAYDVIINVPPGSTKSTICSIMFPAWVWTRMEAARIISASYAATVATDNSRKSRMVIESDLYKSLFPTVVLRDDQNAKTFYETSKGGDRVAVGTGGAITGRHGHFLIVDDPINPKEARSKVEIVNADTWIRETFATRKVDKSVSVMIIIMQRLHEDDPTGKRLREADKNPVRHICLPAELPPIEANNVFPVKLREKYVNGLMDPVRMPKTVLEGEKQTLGAYGYAGQYDQSPTPLSGGMFEFAKIIPDYPPAKFVEIVRYWDKAGTHEGGAFTAGVKMGKDKEGLFWLLDVVRGQWDSGKRERIILQTAMTDTTKIRVGVEQEPGSGGKESMEGTVKRLAGFRVDVDKVSGDKVLRADPFSVQVNNGNVRVPVGASWWPEFRNEMQFFPFGSTKDQIDAASGAFAQLTKKRLTIGGLSFKKKES
jgi:predicted phage terminase large subunit-like protein